MTSDQTGLRVAGAWLAGASLLLALALSFHGPLHPNLEVQMTHIGECVEVGGRPLDRSCRILLFRHRGRSRAGESFADDEHWQDDFGLGGGFGWGGSWGPRLTRARREAG